MGDVFYTKKRKFLVGGVSPSQNSIMYVQGKIVKTDSEGNFMSFVSLNNGLNKIEISDFNGVVFDFDVFLENDEFKLTQKTYDKVIGEDNLLINLEQEESSNFEIFVNGVLKESSNELEFTSSLSGFSGGKNVIEFRGFDKSYFDIIYFDQVSPKINLLNENSKLDSDEIVFQIFDGILGLIKN